MDKNGARKVAASFQGANKQVNSGHSSALPQQSKKEESNASPSLLQQMEWSYPNGHDGLNTIEGLEFMPGRAFNDPTLTSLALQDKSFSNIAGQSPSNGCLPDELMNKDRNSEFQLPVDLGGNGTGRPISFSPCFDEACSAPTTEDLFAIPLEELAPKVPALYNFLEEGNFDNIQDVVDYSMQLGQSSIFKHRQVQNPASSGSRKRKRKDPRKQ